LFSFLMTRLPPCFTLFPYTTLFRSLRRIEDISGLVDTKFFENDSQFGLKYLANPVFYGIFKCKVDGLNRMGLSNTINASDALFEAHRIPGNIVIDNYMRKLKIEAFTSGLC